MTPGFSRLQQNGLAHGNRTKIAAWPAAYYTIYYDLTRYFAID
jgi:hypothetical protein